MRKYFLHAVVSLTLLASGCNFLDVVPENDIQTIETIFEKREQVETWLKSCYVLLPTPIISVNESPAFMGADEVVVSDFLKKAFYFHFTFAGLNIANGLQMTQEPYGNIWRRDQYFAAIRYCNIFFENIHRVNNMQESEKKLWTAELKALKAHFYFEMMRRYGPIILIPENIPANSEIEMMQLPRSPLDECVNTIVSLLDEAMVDLPPMSQKAGNRVGYHSLESAAALKAQTLLYAASRLFNGNPAYAELVNKKGVKLFSAYDPNKWKRAALAIDSAVQICVEEGGKSLIENFKPKATKLLSVMADVEASTLAPGFKNNEALLMLRPQGVDQNFWHKWTLPRFKDSDENFNGDYWGCVSPSIKMVEMYYTENGLPIEADPTWEYNTRYNMSTESNEKYEHVVPQGEKVLGLHLKREPRFYAHIGADRCYWQRGISLEENNMLIRNYQGEQFGSQYSTINETQPQNISGYWLKKGTYSDFTTKTYGTQIGAMDQAAVVIRLAELYLMQAEAWNEVLEAPTAKVYDALDKVRKRAGIPDVRASWANAKTPEKVNTKEGMREIIHQEWNIEFAFEGRRFWNLRRWMTAQDELNSKQYGWNILGKTAAEFYNNYAGPVPVQSKRKFIAPRDYLFPIRSEEVMISNCVQNLGW